MIKIIVVDDLESKRKNILRTISDNHNINIEDIDIAVSMKEARKLLYNNYYDLMILDLVLPVEEGQSCEAMNGTRFLNEIQTNPSIKPPIHIVGLSGYQDQVLEFHNDFRMKLWNLINYDETSSGWEDQLNSIIFHLVKTRQNFIEKSIDNQVNVLFEHLEKYNLVNTFIGLTWKDIASKLSEIIEKSLDVPKKFSNGGKAKNINSETILISSEYDFQNYIHVILRPWIPSVEAENIAIVFDGNTKNADFSIKGNSLIIEAKYIDSTGKKNDTLKTLKGLQDFYKQNANVKSLLFLILVEQTVDLDKHKIESEFSQLQSEPYTVVKVVVNTLAARK